MPGKPFYLTPFITALPFIVYMGKNNISPSPLTGRTCQSAGQAAAWQAGQEAWQRDSQPWDQVLCTQSCSKWGLNFSVRSSWCPQAAGRWEGQNPRCGKGTGLQGMSEGDKNTMRDDRRKEITWFEEDHAAPIGNWSKVRMWWVMDCVATIPYSCVSNSQPGWWGPCRNAMEIHLFPFLEMSALSGQSRQSKWDTF